MEKQLEELTIKELQEKLVSLGMPEDDVSAFKTKPPLIASIRTMLAKSAIEAESKPVEKVATIEEKPNPTEDREVNRRWKTKAEQMKIHLEKQEKVSILIPLEPNERMGVVEWRTGKDGQDYQVHISGSIESVQLNGYKYLIPKGVYTKVPAQIADVIGKAQQQTLEAGSHITLDRIDPKTGRPFSEIF